MKWLRKKRKKQLTLNPDHSKPLRKNDRRCIVTGDALSPNASAIRFVAGPEARLFPDLDKKLPGRGAWVTAEHATLLRALEKNQFARALKQQVHMPDDAVAFIADISQLLRQKALKALGLAKKSGALITGFEKVSAGLKKQQFVAYIHAKDGARDGSDKLKRIISAIGAPNMILNEYRADELEQALGMEKVIHLGLQPHAVSAKFLWEMKRYSDLSLLEAVSAA